MKAERESSDTKEDLQTLNEKLFANENELFLDQADTIKIDLRSASQAMLQDNMLTTLRLLNSHPFAPMLLL